jgi:hypothetical protein
MNTQSSPVVNDRSLTQVIHRCTLVCTHTFRNWFSRVVMIDDPYDEAEQNKLAERLQLEMASLRDNVKAFPKTVCRQRIPKRPGSRKR